MRRAPTLLLLLAVVATAPPAVAELPLPEYIRASYTKYERRIEMRDGARLFTAAYIPKDDSRTYAIMLMRTPYSLEPYGVDRYPQRLGPSEKFARSGFIFVYQDVRGRHLSEGEFADMTPHRPHKEGAAVDESTDTWDTIDWLVRNLPNSNGRVGTWGISYAGFYAAAGMIDAHPALRAASPQGPIADLYMGDDSYHNGVLQLAANFDFMTHFVRRGKPTTPAPTLDFDYGTRDGYEFFLAFESLNDIEERYFHYQNPYWAETVHHSTYDDYWQQRDISRHLYNTSPAVLTVGGWFDAEDLAGPLKVYHSTAAKNPGIANHLVMGPWAHGGWAHGDGDRLGDVRFDSKTAEYYREQIEFPFFDLHLNGSDSGELAVATVFETGTNRWRKYDRWPPPTAAQRSLYLRANGRLSFDAPSEAEAVDEYPSDPARPVPFIDYPEVGMPRAYMVGDQRFASKRPDVLVYQTEILDRDITVVGPIVPRLWVSTTGTDSDFVVKLIDVYPADYPDIDPNPTKTRMGGYQQLVRGEPFRARFRNSFEKPQAMVAGELTAIGFTMPDINHVFRRGHRIMVQIQSSWFPLNDRNPQTFVDIATARAEDFRRATQRVSRSATRSSRLEILVAESPE